MNTNKVVFYHSTAGLENIRNSLVRHCRIGKVRLKRVTLPLRRVSPARIDGHKWIFDGPGPENWWDRVTCGNVMPVDGHGSVMC